MGFFDCCSREIRACAEAREGAYPGSHATEHQLSVAGEGGRRRARGWPETLGHRGSRPPGYLWLHQGQGAAHAHEGAWPALLHRLSAHPGKSHSFYTHYLYFTAPRWVEVFKISRNTGRIYGEKVLGQKFSQKRNTVIKKLWNSEQFLIFL